MVVWIRKCHQTLHQNSSEEQMGEIPFWGVNYPFFQHPQQRMLRQEPPTREQGQLGKTCHIFLSMVTVPGSSVMLLEGAPLLPPPGEPPSVPAQPRVKTIPPAVGGAGRLVLSRQCSGTCTRGRARFEPRARAHKVNPHLLPKNRPKL